MRKDPPATPGPSTFEISDPGSTPSVLTLEGGDAALGTGAPLDELDEVVSGFDASPSCSGLALAQDGDGLDAESLELGVHRGLAISTVGGDGVGDLAGGGDDPLDGGSEAGCVGGHAGLDLVVEDDAVAVVADLAGVAELGCRCCGWSG
jgi:hypothetical protein